MTMKGNAMQWPTITDDTMKAGLATTRAYCAVVLKATPKLVRPAADGIIWEHGRRNYALRAAALMPIVCPVTDRGEVAGFCIFDAPADEVWRIMDTDPGVMAGIFTYEVHNIRSFPGDSLPR